MTQEEKSLLLQDLCARLPYDVIVDYRENEFETPHWKITAIYPETMDGRISYYKRIGVGSESGSRPFKIGEVKPYLRPMSSMTEEEDKEYAKIIVKSQDCSYENNESATTMVNDWYLSKGFDVRGLIPKGLALEAPKDMYK